MIDNKYLLVLILLLLCLVKSFAQRGRPDLNRPGGFNPEDAISSAFDSIERPLLKISKFDLSSLTIFEHHHDTTLNLVHVVEPLNGTGLFLLNIGSENSATQDLFYDIEKAPLSFGHTAYLPIFKKTSTDFIYESNRAFWDIHYGQGMNIGSSNLSTSFYNSFARNIAFNFNYDSINDDGWRSNQSNEFSRMNIKFSQRSKAGNRVTYIEYDRPSFADNLRFDALDDTADGISISKSERKFSIGNRIAVKDTSGQIEKYKIYSKLTFQSKEFESMSSSLSSDSLVLIPLKLTNSLSYNHSISSAKLYNLISFSKFSGEVNVGLDIEALSESQDTILNRNLFASKLNFGYSRHLNSGLKYFSQINVGFFDASGLIDARVEIQGIKYQNIELGLKTEYGHFLPSLDQQNLIVSNTVFQESSWNNINRLAVNLTSFYRPTNTGLELGLKKFKNLILIDNRGFYNQIAASTDFYYARIRQSLRLGFIKTHHNLIAQSVTNKRLSFPKFQYKGSYFVDLRIFKKKMSVRLGADLNYIPSLDTPEFYPVTASFTNYQNNSTSDNLIFINPYLNAQVDSFNFFVKGINVLRRIYSNDIRLVTGFPVYDTRLRFGVKWNLLD